MITLLNPAPVGVGDANLVGTSLLVQGSGLAAGATAGTVAGGAVTAFVKPILDRTLGGTFASVAQAVLHFGAAWGLGYAMQNMQGAFMTNLRVGAQASIIATGLLPALDEVSGGAVSKGVAAIQSAVTPVAGYIRSDFGGQPPAMASLAAPVGNQYIVPLGATYGRSGSPGIRLAGNVPGQFSQAQLGAVAPSDLYFSNN
jgi:hypothetical protein